MAGISVTLGPRWEGFVRSEIESGRYKDMSEAVRAGLRKLEERREKLRALREHLVTGFGQAQHHGFVDDASSENVVARAKARTATKEWQEPFA